MFFTMLIAASIILLDILSLHFGTVVLGGPSKLALQQNANDINAPHFDTFSASRDNRVVQNIESEETLVTSKAEAEGGADMNSGSGESNTKTTIDNDAAEVKSIQEKKRPPPRRRSNPLHSNPEEDNKVDKIERLSARLRHTKVLLGKQRTVSNSRLTCGGSHTVQWRSYRDLRDSFMDKNKLYRHLPENSVSLIDLSKSISNSTCFRRHRYNYKQNNCTFVPPTTEQGPHDIAELCAVVDNGGRLRQEYHQEAIDAADIVIRFNQGITHGYEKNVGSKSTIRMYNGPYISPKQPGEITIAQIREMAIRTWVKAAQKHEGEHLGFMFDPDFICHAWDWVDRQGEKPSSGLVGIILSLRLCKHTNVYGFQFDEYFNNNTRPHYYNWERPKPGREHVHPFAEEKKLYKTLEQRGMITLF